MGSKRRWHGVKIPPAALNIIQVSLASSNLKGKEMYDIGADRVGRTGSALCELCHDRPATRKVKFTAQYLQSSSMILFDEESLVTGEFEKRTCEECLVSLQNAKNVTNLTFERL